MSFINEEASQQDSNYFELFKFTFVNSGITYHYTSGPVSYIHEGASYETAEMKRMETSFQDVYTNSGTKFQLNILTPMITYLAGLIVREKIEIVITRVQKTTNETGVIFIGFISAFNIDGDLAEMEVAPPSLTLHRTMLIRKYSLMCPYALYNAYSCKVDRFPYAVSGDISGISQRSTISSSVFGDKPNHYYTNGYLELGGYKYSVVSHIGSACVLHTKLEQSVQIGDTFIVYAGCDHTPNTCNIKFGNIINFGGFPWIPSKNPFTGDPVA